MCTYSIFNYVRNAELIQRVQKPLMKPQETGFMLSHKLVPIPSEIVSVLSAVQFLGWIIKSNRISDRQLNVCFLKYKTWDSWIYWKKLQSNYKMDVFFR